MFGEKEAEGVWVRLRTFVSGRGCSGQWWNHHSWSCSEAMWMGHLGTWGGGGLGGAGERLDSVVLEGFSILNDSVVLK